MLKIIHRFSKVNSWYYVLGLSMVLTLFHLSGVAYGQVTINVTETTPCFLNYTASYHIIENCNAEDDYIEWVLQTWMWVTGGWFPMIIVSIIIGAVYIKYENMLYPIYIGIVFLPISWMYFPEMFLSWAIIMAFVGIGILIWYTVLKQSE